MPKCVKIRQTMSNGVCTPKRVHFRCPKYPKQRKRSKVPEIALLRYSIQGKRCRDPRKGAGETERVPGAKIQRFRGGRTRGRCGEEASMFWSGRGREVVGRRSPDDTDGKSGGLVR